MHMNIAFHYHYINHWDTEMQSDMKVVGQLLWQTVFSYTITVHENIGQNSGLKDGFMKKVFCHKTDPLSALLK